jgi:hypothetical protein
VRPQRFVPGVATQSDFPSMVSGVSAPYLTFLEWLQDQSKVKLVIGRAEKVNTFDS